MCWAPLTRHAFYLPLALQDAPAAGAATPSGPSAYAKITNVGITNQKAVAARGWDAAADAAAAASKEEAENQKDLSDILPSWVVSCMPLL